MQTSTTALSVAETSPLSQAPARQTVTGIGAGTLVMTADGALPVEFLNPGDRVVTRSGMRVLRRIHMHRYSGRAIRVSRGALGHDRPDRDLTLPESTQILLRDWRAETLFGTGQALVPISRIADGEFIANGRVRGMHVYELQFDTPQVVYAEGVELAAGAVKSAPAPIVALSSQA